MKSSVPEIPPFQQRRRFGAFSIVIANVVGVALALLVASFELARRGELAGTVLLTALVLTPSVVVYHFWLRRINKFSIEWDGEYVKACPIIGECLCLKPKDAILIISNAYIAIRDVYDNEVAVSRGMFRKDEWIECIAQLKSLGFMEVIEPLSSR